MRSLYSCFNAVTVIIAFVGLAPIASLLGQEERIPDASLEWVRGEFDAADDHLRAFTAKGNFSVSVFDEELPFAVAGSFTWKRMGEKFWCEMIFGKCKDNAYLDKSVFDARYLLVCDGDAVIVVEFAARQSKGCEAQLFEVNSSYREANPYIPFEPHQVDSFLHTPSSWREAAVDGDMTDRGLEGMFSRGNMQLRFVLDKNSRFQPTLAVFEDTKTQKVLMRNERRYTSTNRFPVPLSNRLEVFSKSGELARVTEVNFSSFDVDQTLDSAMFGINGVDFCSDARLIDRSSGDTERIIKSNSEHGFRSELEGIRAPLEQFKESEHASRQPPKRSVYLFSLVAFVLFAAALIVHFRSRFNRKRSVG